MPEPSGLELLVEFLSERVLLLRSAPIPHVPSLWLRRPVLSEKTVDRFRPGDAEVVLALLDGQGGVVELFGWSAKGRRYDDWVQRSGQTPPTTPSHQGGPEDARDSKRPLLRGGPHDLSRGERDLRVLRVPLRERCVALFFYRAEVVDRDAKIRIRRTPLGLFLLDSSGRPPATLPFGLEVPPSLAMPLVSTWTPEPTPESDGFIVDVKHDSANGPSSTRFDIVITGDGFASVDLEPNDAQYGLGASRFDYHAKQVRDYLSTIEPFRSVSVRNLINWHVIVAQSTACGVDQCPDPDTNSRSKHTFYEFECWWDDPRGPVLGTHHQERVVWAASQVAPWEEIDLVIVIVNCDKYVAHAWPDFKCAVVATSPSPSEWNPTLWVPSWVDPTCFNQLAAHEVGHVVARLADERIVCEPEDPFRPDPNKAHLPEVGASVKAQLLRMLQGPVTGASPMPVLEQRLPVLEQRLRGWDAVDSVWWKGLADPSELTGLNLFTAVATPLGGPAPGTSGYLGAFWGCQDTHSCEDLAKLLVALTDSPEAPQSGPGSSADLLQMLPGFLNRLVRSECDIEADIRGACYYRAMAECRMRHINAPFCRVCQHLIANAVKGISGQALTPPLPSWVP
jgi:hypothetical protein